MRSPGSECALTAGIACVAEIFTLVEFVTGHFHLISVDDDYIVTAVEVGGEVGLIFATKNFCHF